MTSDRIADLMLRAASDAAEHKDLGDQLDRAESIIAAVRALHQPIGEDSPDHGFCQTCDSSWPCSTTRVIDEEDDE